MKSLLQNSRSPRVHRTQAPAHVPIPERFTEVQAETILAIARIGTTDIRFAEQLLKAWTPERFTDAQAQCVREMLGLETDDLHATLTDAMEPCELCWRLRSQIARSGSRVPSGFGELRNAGESRDATLKAAAGAPVT